MQSVALHLPVTWLAMPLSPFQLYGSLPYILCLSFHTPPGLWFFRGGGGAVLLWVGSLPSRERDIASVGTERHSMVSEPEQACA